MTIVFTAILSPCDSLKPAPKGADRCVCFVDDVSAHPDAKGWELIQHPCLLGDPRREAWRLRCLPHELFLSYDRVIWIDASFTLTDLPRLLKDAAGAPVSALRHHTRSSAYDEAARLVVIGQSTANDIERQIADYREANYRPEHLSISCIIVRDSSESARRFNECWAEQIRAYPGDNTQVSLDFSAWANAFSIRALQGTRHANPYSVHDHADHKKRRQPYRQVSA